MKMEHNKEEKSQSPLSNARWIAPSLPVAAPVFRKVFYVSDSTAGGTLYITGLGYFEFLINGRRMTDDMFIPPTSDYFRRDFSKVTYPVRDRFTHRIYYHRYDLSGYLRDGENVLEVRCGGGWLVQTERLAEGEMNYSDRPACIFSVMVKDREIVSDGSESWRESEIRYSQLFIGEVIDYGFSDKEDKAVITLPHPDSILSEAIGSPDRVIRTVIPSVIFKGERRRVYDVGENVSALVSLTAALMPGDHLTLRFSELINEDFSLDFRSTGSAYRGKSGENQIMRDVFFGDGKRRKFTPSFVWHAFRYFEILGCCDQIDDVEVLVIHAAVVKKSSFDSDSEGMNFLYDAYCRTQLSAYHGSFPADCPHRERLGYTGDGQITAGAAMMIFDAKELYRKWIRDILDSQDRESGHIQHTAPFQGGGGGPGGWCSAVVTVPYAFTKEYGYDEILKDALPAMERWIDFTEGCMDNGLIVKESDGGWCLGDWCCSKEAELPPPFVNTCWFIHAIRLYRELAEYAGRKCPRDLGRLEELCLRGVQREYKGLSELGTAKIYAAWIGIEDRIKVVEFYKEKGHLDTGFLATDILFELLFEGEGVDVAASLLDSRDPGSFLFMKDRGATTLWERWHGDTASRSHPMFGGCTRQLFSGLLGISQPYGSFGYDKIAVNPKLPQKMKYAKGWVLTCKGRICVELQRTDGEVKGIAYIGDKRIL